MKKEKNFRAYSIPVIIISFLAMYMYSGLQNDHTNVLQPYMSSTFGWSATKITNPMTFGAYFVIVFTFIVGTLLLKIGVKKVMTMGLLVMGVASIVLGIAIPTGNYPLYAVSLFFVRSFTCPLFMASMMYCTNWFVKTRGRVMGIVTIGCPLESATLIAILTFASTTALGLTGAYVIIGIIMFVMALVCVLFTKDTPEEVGMNPDGGTETYQAEEVSQLTIKEIFANKNTWFLVIGMGFCQFMIIANMAFFVTNCRLAGTDQSVYLSALSIGAILGIPISYLLGWVDDRFGTIKACFILCITFFMTAFGMLMIHGDSMGMIIITVLGMAGMTGGTPNLLPSLTSYIFGRKNYQAANRWTFTFMNIMASFAALYMSVILDRQGSLRAAYIGEIIFTVIAFACFLFIGRTPDYDRAKMKKEQA